MRTAAARLGLGLAAASARQNISFSLFMRRSSTSLAAAAAAAGDVSHMKSGSGSGSESEMELELNKDKSLYLCFSELCECGTEWYWNQVVRSIRMSSDDNNVAEEEEYLGEAAYKRTKVNKGWNNPSRFGSQILFPFGRSCANVTHISSIDTSTRPLKFQTYSPAITLSLPKESPVLGELNRKLFCIDTIRHNSTITDKIARQSRPFEVLDPEIDLKWRPLDAPPFIQRDTDHFYASFLDGSNKILGWADEQPGVFCFDATRPENGWSETGFSLGNTLPSLIGNTHIRTPIFIRNHHPNLGAFHLMFIYDPINAPLLVSAYFMSDKCDNFHRIEDTPLKLPDLCDEYYNELTELNSDIIYSKFLFVHLGVQKVCLVLNKFFNPDHFECENTGMLLLVTFEYDIIPTTVKDSKSAVQIQTRLFETRRFRYHSRQLRKPNGRTIRLYMTGAFLL